MILLTPLPPDGLIYTYQPDDPVYVVACTILCSNLLIDSVTFETELKFRHILKDPGPDSFLFLDLSVHHSPFPYPILLAVPPLFLRLTRHAATSEPLYFLLPLWQICTRRRNDVDHRGMISPEQVSTKVSSLMLHTP